MSFIPRDEGGRSRRRRRRGGGPSIRPDSEHHPPIRPPRRRPPSPSHPHPSLHRTPPTHTIPNSHTSHRPPTPVHTPPRTIPPNQPASTSTVVRSDQQSPVQPAASAPGVGAKNDAQSVDRNGEDPDAELRRQQQEERERSLRELQLAQQSARRQKERVLNLSYFVPKIGDPARKERPSDSELRQLDSSLKKCTGFLRKIRSAGLAEDSVAALCVEAQTLNLSRYISEVVTALSEIKMRSADVEHVVVLCGQLYRQYDDFVAQFVTALGAVILGGGKDLGTRKAAMRLLVEMFVLGMTPEITPITNVLKQIMRGAKDVKEESLSNLAIIASFIRAGSRTLLPRPVAAESGGEPSRQQSNAAEMTWEDQVLPQSTKVNLSSALQSYYENEVVRLFKEAVDDVQNTHLGLKRSKNARGDPDDAAIMAHESAKQFYDRINTSSTVLALALGKQPPEDVMGVCTAKGGKSESGSVQGASQVYVANPLQALGKSVASQNEADGPLQDDSPFDGEEERLFYTDLPHSKHTASSSQNRKEHAEASSSTSTEKYSADTARDSAPPTRHAGGIGSRHDLRQTATARTSAEHRRRGSDKPLTLEKLLSRLPTVESKESADNFVDQFLEVVEGSKNGSKRLAKSLHSVSPQKLNLLPAYTRVAACLHSTHADVANTVGSSLEEEFRFLVGRSDVDEKNLAACIKYAKYVGEYVKFSLFTTTTFFDLLGICMKDFSGHRVDIACHLVETCGRFVYRTPSTHIRMGNILDTLWRLKSVKNLEVRHNSLVETAFFAARPSTTSKLQKRKDRPPLHEYIRHLIYNRLEATNINWTQTQLLKLPWDAELEHYVIKKFVKISRARFSTIPYVALLVARLRTYKGGLVVGIVDALLESIRYGLEKNDGRDSQHRIAELQLLGELQKCGVVEEKVIYYVLYQCITLGHDAPDPNNFRPRPGSGSAVSGTEQAANVSPARPQNGSYTSAPDPPGDFFRIRLACVLVESCGRFLADVNRRKLEVFWVFLERYVFCKAFQAGFGDRIPLHIKNVVSDAFEQAFQRDRPLVRDPRVGLRKEPDLGGRGHLRQETWSTGRISGFRRSETLAESVEAVKEVEKSPHDSSLICVPVRYILRGAALKPDDLGRSEEGTKERRARRVSGQVSSRSSNGPANHIVDNEIDVSLSDEYEPEEDEETQDQEGPEPLTFEILHDEYENGASVDGESLSFDGTVEEDEDEVLNGHDDDVEEDDDEDDDDDDSSLEVEVERPKTEEEDAFSKELAAFTAEAVQSARASSSRVTKLDRMTIPMSLMTKKMEQERAAAAAAASLNSDGSDSCDDEHIGKRTKWKRKQKDVVRAVEFKMLIRKGGKSQLHDLHVPASSSLAQAAKENETADAARHEETKRLVLESTIVMNHDEDDLDEEVPLRTQQNVRDKEESIRQQRSEDERELLATLYKNKPRR